MRRLTRIESNYWVDSFPVDLALGACTGLVTAGLTAYLADSLASNYYDQHSVIDPGTHGMAALFLALVLAIFAFFVTVAAVLVLRLFLRMYRNPL